MESHLGWPAHVQNGILVQATGSNALQHTLVMLTVVMHIVMDLST